MTFEARVLLLLAVALLLVSAAGCSSSRIIAHQGPWIWLQKDGETVGRLFILRQRGEVVLLRVEIPEAGGAPGTSTVFALTPTSATGAASQADAQAINESYDEAIRDPLSSWTDRR